jgi:hypothetical protein
LHYTPWRRRNVNRERLAEKYGITAEQVTVVYMRVNMFCFGRAYDKAVRGLSDGQMRLFVAVLDGVEHRS